MNKNILERLLLKPEKKDWDIAIIYSTGKQPMAVWKKTVVDLDTEHNAIYLQLNEYPNPFVDQDPDKPLRTMQMDAFMDIDSITAIDYLKENRVQKVSSKIIT